MNPTILERLLIDRKLGELPPEAEALLEDYLQLNPEHRILAEGVERTLDAAGAVLGRAVDGRNWPLPPQPLLTTGLAAPGPWRIAILTWSRRAAVAAAIGLAFLLGNLTRSEPSSILALNKPRAVLPAHLATEADGFWSLRRLQQNTGAAVEVERQRIEWSAPVGIPKIGERT